MKSTPVRNGINAGIVFGILVIFSSLTGFTLTATKMIGNAVNTMKLMKTTGAMAWVNLVIFVVLLGFFAGWMAAKRRDPDKIGDALISGLVAGVIAGIIAAAYAYLIGSLDAAKVNLRNYLPYMSKDAIKQFLFLKKNDLITPALMHFGYTLGGSLLGALFARWIVRGKWRLDLNQKFVQGSTSLASLPWVVNLRNSAYFRYIALGLVFVGLFLIPRSIGSYWNYVLGLVGLYVLMGLGLNIIVGYSGQLVLGYVAFFAMGAYSFALLTAPEPHHIMLTFWQALPLSVLLASLTGVLLGLPLLNLRGDYLAIVTLGFGEIIRILLKSDILAFFTGGPKGLRQLAQPKLFGKPFNGDVEYVYLITLAVILVIYVTQRLKNSHSGRGWESIREDQTVSQAMGVNTYSSKLLALAIGAGFAGLAGALFASRNLFTGPEDHILMVSINVLCLVIVGGMGSIPGVILGAFVLKGLPELLRDLELYRMLAFGALLVVMMIIRPEGLWPSSRPKLENQFLEINNSPQPTGESGEKAG